MNIKYPGSGRWDQEKLVRRSFRGGGRRPERKCGSPSHTGEAGRACGPMACLAALSWRDVKSILFALFELNAAPQNLPACFQIPRFFL